MEDFQGRTRLLSADGFDAVAGALQADACALWALLTVETAGFGFLPSRRPKILFERHIFSKRTGGQFDGVAPDISSKSSGGYEKDEEKEYDRLGRAIALDRQAALDSTSWGLGQIMGFNATSLGYANVDEMIARFCDGEDAQLDGVMRFVQKNGGLHAALRTQDWKTVARQYNGPDYERNEYDFKLERHFNDYKAKGAPDIAMRAAQARLTYLRYSPGGIDGIFGARTKAALTLFQQQTNIPVTGKLDDRTQLELERAAGF